MVKFENQCVGCHPETGCIGRTCPNRRVPIIYCDRCEEETRYDEIRHIDGEDICYDCFMERCSEEFYEAEKVDCDYYNYN